ncbi:hypothetical protein SEA_MAVERICK_90 [Mycobacterium phage Maverick]|uniref:Uncharacterized protein n=1 Tax=Mycobacterium phage Maverick TaxID=1701799 RepID=A0A0M4R146_9CAUD|nr:hypothetical protein SEA_MAVERICK_90 [Mycobacterium phage Maverick]
MVLPATPSSPPSTCPGRSQPIASVSVARQRGIIPPSRLAGG